MKSNLFLISLIAVSLFFTTCKNSGKTDLPIPKDAVMVMHINTRSLTSKLSWKDIKETNWFQEMAADEKDSVTKKILENPEKSGVDLTSDLAFFMKKQGKGGYMVFEGKLKDADAFETMVTGMKKNITVQKDGDIKYASLGQTALLTWNGSRFFVINDAPFFAQASPFGNRNYGNPNSSFTTDSFRLFTKNLLSLNEDNSIGKDDRFKEMMKEKGDVHVFFNTDQYYSSLGGGMMSMLKMNTLFQGNASTMTLNFEEGKIVATSKGYFGKEMAKVMDQFKTKKVEASVINRIPSKDVVGVLAMNVDPAGIREFLKVTGFDGMANGFLGDMGYSLDELLQATNGEFVVAVTDLQMKKQEFIQPAHYQQNTPNRYARSSPDMKILFASSVNDRKSFDKLLGIVKEKMGEGPMQKINYKVSNDWFVAGNNASSVDGFLAGGNNHIPFADKISGHSCGMFVDLQKVFRAFGTDSKNASDSALYLASLNMWQDVEATMGEYKNGTITGNFTINLMDKSMNSLKQINRYAQQLSAAKKMRIPANDMMLDSIQNLTPVPPQANQ